MSTPDYFTSDRGWEAYAFENGYPLPSNATPSLNPIEPLGMDIAQARAGQAESDAEWAAAHPLEEVGCVSKFIAFKVRDGTEISVKVSHPDAGRLRKRGDAALPVLFVTHGGGWIQGTHLSEEAWLLRPLYAQFNLVVISVEYRLAPEHQFPTWIEDCWDVLENLFASEGSMFSDLGLKLDLEKVILAGSSSGAGISAILSQTCRDEGVSIFGVILNVPVLCDYRHFPAKYRVKGSLSSYQQCVETFSSGAMVWVWNQVQPSALTGADPRISPLLGDCGNLPRHMVFVAGQDALRDDGIAYATKLKEAGVQIDLNIYKGLPHHFSQISELKATARFQEDLRTTLKGWLDGL